MQELLLSNFVKGPDNGPGPKFLESKYNYPDGVRSTGYYGLTTANELLTNQELITLVGLNGLCDAVAEEASWVKMDLDGKVIYLPINGIATNIKWRDIYSKGLVYGIDGVGANPAGPGVNQNTIIEAKGYSFRIRLMTGSDSDPYSGPNAANDPPSCIQSDYSRLAYNILSGSYGYQQGPKFASLEFGGYRLCQEAGSWFGNPDHRIMRVSDQGRVNLVGIDEIRADFLWSPLLELIPS